MPQRYVRILPIVLVLMLTVCPALRAGNTFWTGNVDNDWHNPGNWSHGLPTDGDNAYVGPHWGAPTRTVAQFSTGSYHFARMDVSHYNDNNMTLEMFGGSILADVGNVAQGTDGTVTLYDGSLEIHGSSSGQPGFGRGASRTGTLNVHDGSVTLVATGYSSIGYHGHGVVNQWGGSVDLQGLCIASVYGTGTASYTMHGGTLTTDNLRWGSVGNAEMTIYGGNVTIDGDMEVTYGGGNRGLLHMVGGTAHMQVGHLKLGNGDAELRFTLDDTNVADADGGSPLIDLTGHLRFWSGGTSRIDVELAPDAQPGTYTLLDGVVIANPNNKMIGRAEDYDQNGNWINPDWTWAMDNGEGTFTVTVLREPLTDQIPEPATLLAATMGLAGLVRYVRRRR